MGAQAKLVRDDILKRVLARDLAPGDRVDESELKNRLALSGTPIREAIITLEAEGILHRRPRDGARIAALDLESLMKLIEVLAETEGVVACRAARRINREQAQRLTDASEACDRFAEGAAAGSYFDLNMAFHRSLIAAAGNEYLEQAVFRTANRLVSYLAARHDLPGEPERSASDHREIARAVLSNDGDGARDLMIRHVMFDADMALGILNQVNT